MNVQEIYARLLHPYRPWLLAHDFEAIDPWIEIRSDGLADLCRYLRSEPDLKFDMLHCITAIDFWKPDVKKTEKGDVKGAAKGDSPILAGSKTGTVPGEKKGTVPDELPPHIELTYHLSSMKHRHKLVLKARIPRWLEDEPGLLPEGESLYNYYQVIQRGPETWLKLNEGIGIHSVYHPQSALSEGIWDYFLVAPLFAEGNLGELRGTQGSCGWLRFLRVPVSSCKFP